MSEWLKNYLKPLIKETVEETAKEFDEQFYRGVVYGEEHERLKKDIQHEQELYKMFNEGRKHERQMILEECGEIEEITAEEFDRLTAEENTPKTEIPDGFGFAGTIDDISLVLDEEAV